MSQVFYKKVNLDSTSINGLPKWSIRYYLNTWTYPLPDTDGLFVFDTLENAKNFPYGHAIYECKVVNPRLIKVIFDVVSTDSPTRSTEGIGKFWKMRRQRKKPKDICLMSSPKGTYLCDAVMITQRVG